jgi:hypothetical protein
MTAVLNAVAAGAPAARLTPNDLLDKIQSVLYGRGLSEVLKERNVVFLASHPRLRSTSLALTRDRATFPFVYTEGHELTPHLKSVLTSKGLHRAVLFNAGVRGSGKTVLLLRALDAVPAVVPELSVARIYVTFDSPTDDVIEPGGRGFNAGLLLRVFHAVVATLGVEGGDTSFNSFLDTVDWQRFEDRGILPKLATALGVESLIIAVDEVATGIRLHKTADFNLKTHTDLRLNDIFCWTDIVKASAGAQVFAEPAAVTVFVSCYYPRYAMDASIRGRLVPLEVDLAPCLDAILPHVKRWRQDRAFKDQPEVAADVFYRQRYAACGGHFLLCARFFAAVSAEPIFSHDTVGSALAPEITMLADELTPRGPGFATIVAQVVSGMTYEQLESRHGDAALPFDKFFQSSEVPSNLPLAVVLSPSVSGDMRFSGHSPLINAFDLWRQAACQALQQTEVEGLHKVFEAVTMHGLALRWAAFLAPTPTSPGSSPAFAPYPVGFCAGRGAYLDAKGELCWIDLAKVLVREPCAHTGGDEFPPPDHGKIVVSTYTLAKMPKNPAVVEGGGCVAATLPSKFGSFDRVYFTARMKYSPTASGLLADYEGGLTTLFMPDDAPCIHLFWTPKPYRPCDSTLKNILAGLRPYRHSKSTEPFDIVACVSVEECLTPCLAWTLTCAGVQMPKPSEETTMENQF